MILRTLLALAVLAVPVVVAQGSECSGPSANPDSFTLGPDAGSQTVLVFGRGNCSYGVTTTEAWLHVSVNQITTSDTQSTPLTFTYDAYTGDYVRNGRISIYDYMGYAGGSVFVSQSTKAPDSSNEGTGSGHSEGPLDDAARSWFSNNQTPGFELVTALAGAGMAAVVRARRR